MRAQNQEQVFVVTKESYSIRKPDLGQSHDQHTPRQPALSQLFSGKGTVEEPSGAQNPVARF